MAAYGQFLGFDDARRIAARLQQGEAFRRYLARRLRLLVPASVVAVLVSTACAAATAIFFAELNSWLAFPALLLGLVVLLGSLYVQGLAFLAWLEGRALARALGRRPRGAAGPLPRLPWALAALVLFVPLALLLSLSLEAGAVVLLLGAAVPLAILKLDANTVKRSA